MNSKTVSMAAIGFSDNELRILRTVSSLSRSGRPYHFELTTTAPRGDLAVFICNADDAEAMARWNIYRVAFPDAVVVMASRSGLASRPYYTLDRPLSARQILEALDRIFGDTHEAQQDTPQASDQPGALAQLWQRTMDGLLGGLQTPGTLPA